MFKLHGASPRVKTSLRPSVADVREGACLQCGACCRLVHRCPFLSRDNRCKIYGASRPGNCTSFPIDERDLREVPAGCGYRFNGSAGPKQQ